MNEDKSTSPEWQGFVSKHIADIVRLMPRMGTAARNKYLEIAGSSFVAYLSHCRNEYSKLKTILYYDQPKPLYDFFVPLDLGNRDTVIRDSNVQDLESFGKFNIIIGTAGSGKSTLLRHFFLQTLSAGVRIPVFVELRKLNTFEGSLFEYVHSQLQMRDYNLPSEFLKRAFQSDRVHVFLDAFDEVDSGARKRIASQIQSLSTQYPQLKVTVTSRPDDQFVSWSEFSTFEVLPLTKPKAISLAEKIDYQEDVKARFVAKLKSDLYESHKSFLSIPLLLIIMLINYHENATVPSSRHVFYGQVFVTLFNRHDATKDSYERVRLSNLSIDRFERLLAVFCFRTYLKSRFVFPEQQCLDFISESISFLDYSTRAEDFLEDLLKAVCILCRDGLDVTFTHRSFQEYFTARFIMSMDDGDQKKVIARLARSPNIPDVLLLLFGMEQEVVERHFVLPRIELILSPYDHLAFDDGFFDLFTEAFPEFHCEGDGAPEGSVTVGKTFQLVTDFATFLRNAYPEEYSGEVWNEGKGWNTFIDLVRKRKQGERGIKAQALLKSEGGSEAAKGFGLFSYKDYEVMHKLRTSIPARHERATGAIDAWISDDSTKKKR